MLKTFDDIIAYLPKIYEGAKEIREILLSNLIMISEIPAPTFNEGNRVSFLQDRFTECGLSNCSTDEKGNGFGVYHGVVGKKNIILLAHIDTIFSKSVDHTITVLPDRVIGPGVGDNSLGVAVLATVPTLLEKLKIKLTSNLILMGAAKSLGRGNLQGLRFFLSSAAMPIHAGVCVEGIQLGRLNYLSLAMLRIEITCEVPDEYDWTRFGATGAIQTMNQIINLINEIRFPRKPRTSIVLGTIKGGQSFDIIARKAVLRFEIRSEADSVANEIGNQIKDIAAEISSQTGEKIDVDIFAKRQYGGVKFNHPLVHNARNVMKTLDIKPRIAPSTSELSAFIDRKIPAITLGITYGENYHQANECVLIEPMILGLTQLVGILLAIDRGHCDED